MRKPKPLRERAARALCDLNGQPANTKFEGAPMWKSYLPEVDAVLHAALNAESWKSLKDDPDAVELKTPS